MPPRRCLQDDGRDVRFIPQARLMFCEEQSMLRAVDRGETSDAGNSGSGCIQFPIALATCDFVVVYVFSIFFFVFRHFVFLFCQLVFLCRCLMSLCSFS